MVAVIHDRELEARLREERALTGAARFDEVWDGIYMMSLLANDEHQEIVSRLVSVFEDKIGWPGLGKVRPGVNVSDRVEGWAQNYRCPDVAVFLNATSAVNHGTFWLGGPDFAVEVASEGDKSLEKLPFYAKVSTRELMVIHREPWKLELYRLQGNEMRLADQCTMPESNRITSTTLGFSFQLTAASQRPNICVIDLDNNKTWNV